MNKRKVIVDFKKRKESNLYKIIELNDLGIKDESTLFYLSEIGLSVIEDNEYYFFSPFEKLDLFTENCENLVQLGNRFEKNNKSDNLILLSKDTNEIFWYSKSFFEINLVSHLISKVNNSLENFLFFQACYINFIEKSLLSSFKPSIKELEELFNDFMSKIMLVESEILSPKKEEDYRLFWLNKIMRISYELEEHYNMFLPEITKLLPTINKS